jgi:hypothetical protein
MLLMLSVLLRVRLGRGFPRARISGVSSMFLRFPCAMEADTAREIRRVRLGRGFPVEHGVYIKGADYR